MLVKKCLSSLALGVLAHSALAAGAELANGSFAPTPERVQDVNSALSKPLQAKTGDLSTVKMDWLDIVTSIGVVLLVILAFAEPLRPYGTKREDE